MNAGVRGVVLAVVALGSAGAMAGDLGERDATMWAPFVEWSVENPSWEGNPFDVVATVSFAHGVSGASHVTEMFYAGDTTWKFRFTGTRLGEWSFTTASDDPELNGHAGRVVVAPNPDPKIRGFLTHQGNKYAIQGKDADDLRGFLFTVYMNGHIIHTDFKQFGDQTTLGALLDDVQANGFDTAFTYINHNWLKLGVLRHDEHDSVNPDLATFDLLERLITTAHARGMRWHLWSWGDEARKWTPTGLPGGINGEVDRRLQRYIAARLGPLPGWTMGYGFDLIEWTSEDGRNGWADYLHEKMGWDHLLCTRGFALAGEHNNITSYSGFGGNDLTSTRCGPADYAEIVEDIDADPLRPSFYEERHSYKRDGFKLDMTGTRRLRWWEAMAGGMGGFFGFYNRSEHPYPNPEQLRTVHTFWEGRFLLDMARANALSDALVLKTPDNRHFVLYREDADAVAIDLSGMDGPQRAVAVDTTLEYAEVDLGQLDPTQQTLKLPRQSDWAVAVGVFPERKRREPSQQLISDNGWFVHDGRAVWGWIQHNGWWRPGERPNLTRRSVGDPGGDVRPNRTEDFEQLTDNMLRYGYPGFEHNYGLWYDRRRDAHDTTARTDAQVQPPFLEQPWARSDTGTAADGLPKYDLTRFNPWYFKRLKEFADLCDEKGTILFHKYHMQHALLEGQMHYVDFPWRPANCIQDTGMPDTIPAANVFYDVSHPERRKLHRLYIRKCLDVLGDNRNVVHLTGQEFTGPLDFVAFWLDTIREWEAETGKQVAVGLGAPKDVQDAILADAERAAAVDVLDLRYWWYRADGSMFAPEGGRELPGRGIERGSKQAGETSPEQIYRKVREYRDRFPGKAVMDAVQAGREQNWAFLMAGGGMLVRGGISYPDHADPPEYVKPLDVDIVLPAYRFICEHLAHRLPGMGPQDAVAGPSGRLWCLGEQDKTYLVYALGGGTFSLDLSGVKGNYAARWLDPRTGELQATGEEDIAAGAAVTFKAPDERDWALWLERSRP
jgi:Family of unknown function (DUF6298)/Domain of unknown function (DUF5060)/Putative collagen-binding domain of a collagenase